MSKRKSLWKREFIKKMAEKSGKQQKDCAEMYDLFLEIVTGSLCDGVEVMFEGFGQFYIKEYNGRRHYDVNKKTVEFTGKRLSVSFKPSRRFVVEKIRGQKFQYPPSVLKQMLSTKTRRKSHRA